MEPVRGANGAVIGSVTDRYYYTASGVRMDLDLILARARRGACPEPKRQRARAVPLSQFNVKQPQAAHVGTKSAPARGLGALTI